MKASPIKPQKNLELLKRYTALNISEKDLVIKATIGSGNGGQKVNKTANCISIKHLPSGVHVKSQKTRSKEVNLFLAKRLLIEKLEKLELGLKSKKDIKTEKKQKQKKKRKKRSQTKYNE